MIEISNLVKKYGDHVAVDNLSLTIEPGKIYGLLGPNGAGKSTTMNILTGYIGATSGTVKINGYDILDQPEEAKKCVGYLPELPPLYMDMTVAEYLKFVAELKKIEKKKRKEMINDAMEMTGISDVSERLIKNLSKGYRQRVGFAQAVLGYPQIIILDEPTVAVDPQSRNKILEGILQLNREGATIIYTSHYMEEVEQICTRIAIMDKGSKIAEGTTEELKRMIKNTETITAEILQLPENVREQIEALEHVYNVSYADNKLVARCTGGRHNLIEILKILQENQVGFGSVYSEQPTLNDVFLEITGKALRDKE